MRTQGKKAINVSGFLIKGLAMCLVVALFTLGAMMPITDAKAATDVAGQYSAAKAAIKAANPGMSDAEAARRAAAQVAQDIAAAGGDVEAAAAILVQSAIADGVPADQASAAVMAGVIRGSADTNCVTIRAAAKGCIKGAIAAGTDSVQDAKNAAKGAGFGSAEIAEKEGLVVGDIVDCVVAGAKEGAEEAGLSQSDVGAVGDAASEGAAEREALLSTGDAPPPPPPSQEKPEQSPSS